MTNKRDKLFEGALPPSAYRKRVLAENKGKKALLRQNRKSMNHYVPINERNGKGESTIQSEIIRFLLRRGFWVHKAKAVNLVGSGDEMRLAQTQRGVPDILAVRDGHFLAIEVKAARENVDASDDQIYQMQNLRERGAHAFVSHSVEHVKEYLRQSNDLEEFVDWPMVQTREKHIPIVDKVTS